MKNYFLVILIFLFYHKNYSQGCCSGGATNPIAGGAATGVLKQNQVEFSTNHQYSYSDKFLTKNRDTTGAFDHFSSNYLFFRMDYGLSEKLTLSIASGYFLDKTKYDPQEQNTYTDSINTKGFSDLILLPRFGVFNNLKGNKKTELTLGLGMKLPLGSNNDSSLIYSGPIIGNVYSINPFITQTTNGSIDMMFYGFLFRAYLKQKMQIFTNILHLRTGYNSLGQKFGNYTSLGLFFSKKVNKNFGITAQIRAENIAPIQSAENIALIIYNIDQASTGSFKTFFVPQITYTKKNFVFYFTSEIPFYQYVNGTQIGSQIQFTSGINFRFQLKTPSYQVSDLSIQNL